MLVKAEMYYFYVLYSLKDGHLYKGTTEDLTRRLKQHNAGRTPSTKRRRPLILLYFEVYEDKESAMQREKRSKSLEGGVQLKELLMDNSLLDKHGKLNDKSRG